MRIRLTKLSDQRHALEIVRADGSGDKVELLTREALFHDFLHFAVESSLPTQCGFWGALASGKSMADMNDRSGESVADIADILGPVEATVGMMTGVVKLPEDAAFAAIRGYHESQGSELPNWCTERFVADVRECMRRLLGEWKATPYGQTMEVVWTEDGPDNGSLLANGAWR
ncbi:MAG: hypothetical protein R3305_00415 [Gammaproteobacteria bacterium]|nr:hypothetical protein [Gammaproteobacteria bacterium]